MTLIKWNGTDSTRIRPVKGGDKVNVEPGEVVEVAEDQAKFYTNVGGFELYVEGEDSEVCDDCMTEPKEEEVEVAETELEVEVEPETEVAEEEVPAEEPKPEVKAPSKKKGKK